MTRSTNHNEAMTAQTQIYFNTTNLSGSELMDWKHKVVGQAGEVLEVFANNPNVLFTPWDVFRKLEEKFPITSVRARITTLEHDGYLMKGDTVVKSGPYETGSYQWQLHPNKRTA